LDLLSTTNIGTTPSNSGKSCLRKGYVYHPLLPFSWDSGENTTLPSLSCPLWLVDLDIDPHHTGGTPHSKYQHAQCMAYILGDLYPSQMPSLKGVWPCFNVSGVAVMGMGLVLLPCTLSYHDRYRVKKIRFYIVFSDITPQTSSESLLIHQFKAGLKWCDIPVSSHCLLGAKLAHYLQVFV